MFNGLHDVDWASMRHAYGSAEEVPAMLEALRSPLWDIGGAAETSVVLDTLQLQRDLTELLFAG